MADPVEVAKKIETVVEMVKQVTAPPVEVVSRPGREEALQLALMLVAGMPSLDAIRYFYPEDDAERVRFEHDRWMRSYNVRSAVKQVQNGKSWQDMSLDERVKFAVDKHYSELAYFLYTNNYNTLTGQDRQKADICRAALEAKLAGTSGKMDALTSWFDDVKSGRVKLPFVAQSATDISGRSAAGRSSESTTASNS